MAAGASDNLKKHECDHLTHSGETVLPQAMTLRRSQDAKLGEGKMPQFSGNAMPNRNARTESQIVNCCVFVN